MCLTQSAAKVAREEEGDGRAQRGAGQVQGGSPQRSEEHAAGKAEDCTGDEENRPGREQYDVGERSPHTDIVNRALDQRGIEALPIERQPSSGARESEPEQKACQVDLPDHATGSRRPSG